MTLALELLAVLIGAIAFALIFEVAAATMIRIAPLVLVLTFFVIMVIEGLVIGWLRGAA